MVLYAVPYNQFKGSFNTKYAPALIKPALLAYANIQVFIS